MAGPITTLDAYLEGRTQLIASRGVFFSALRSYLRPGQRPDAQRLGDAFFDAPARTIDDGEWVANPTRGYLTILDTAARPFRIGVRQQGAHLRVGVRFPAGFRGMRSNFSRLTQTFGSRVPMIIELSDEAMFMDWHFELPGIFDSAQELESAVFLVGTLFESAIQSLMERTMHA